ncbi:DNA-binding transcriptional regulator, AcrR family [Paenibacillus catalpae]|uniref:DNA-binding transcriptional regulator, AcrR family n=1 Tax=Paenibacillus catalpae TaxID=1045775 RepID=A0A1I1XPL1_9BACL|nr:TetR/AcrR family transcriptional regulator [Paenibacillus catalpae]SFE09252.1 DNA-binding transcriptional regulator, AcrR family [Paenibacillus catalpae]
MLRGCLKANDMLLKSPYSSANLMAKITQELIIETAEALIERTDKPEVTLSQISDELNITHAALYKHFKNKQELWVAVSKSWFTRMISEQIRLDMTNLNARDLLHDWLWAFVNAKKRAYNENPKMFALNTQYVDSNPLVLREVLWDSYQIIDGFMDYQDPHFERAEAILSAFAVFSLPSFKESWNLPDYQDRFERIWNLIKNGI